MSDSNVPETGEHPTDPSRPQAGDRLQYPQSVSDPPKEDPPATNNGPIPDHALVALAPLGYDVLEPKPEAVLLCAKICHAVVEAMNAEHNEVTLTWEISGPSCVAGVERVLANPKETAEQNHEAWMAYKAAEGWKWGPTKDAGLKTHPCMVPYGALGPFARSKDAVFHAIVRTMFGLK